MNSKRQCDLFGHTASYINTSLQRLAIKVAFFVLYIFNKVAIVKDNVALIIGSGISWTETILK